MHVNRLTRWKSRGLGVFALLLFVTQSGGRWTVDQPPTGSTFGEQSAVVGIGTCDEIANAVFKFGYNDGTGFVSENQVLINATGPMAPYNWSGTISVPTGGWNVSPQEDGMYIGDHYALVAWSDATGNWTTSTNLHVVLPQQ